MTESLDLPCAETLPSEALRRCWEPTKAQLVREDRGEGLRIRVHRACRALEQAEAIERDGTDPQALDVALVLRWVALNSLYSAWDSERGAPTPDRVALDRFTTKANSVDQAGRLTAALNTLQTQARALIESPFLIERFWATDEWENIRPQRGRMAGFNNEVLEGRAGAALHRLLMAVYFLRCQIVHGGSTIGSSVNRVVVEPAAQVLRVMVGQLIAIVMENGMDVDWGGLCYPPVRTDAE